MLSPLLPNALLEPSFSRFFSDDAAFTEINELLAITEAEFIRAIQRANTIDDLILALQQFPIHLQKANLTPVNRLTLIQQLLIIADSKQMLQPLFVQHGTDPQFLQNYEIPAGYGFKEKLHQIICQNVTADFIQKISISASFEELMQIIHYYPIHLLSSAGVALDKRTLIAEIHYIALHPEMSIQEFEALFPKSMLWINSLLQPKVIALFNQRWQQNYQALLQQFIAPNPMPPFNENFQTFLKNIQAATPKPINPKLLSAITQQDLSNIYQAFNDSTLHSHFEAINALLPGTSYSIDKGASKLARTLTVLRTMEGEYKLILETKSKLSNGQKGVLPSVKGGKKSGKPAWRIDNGQTEYFNLSAPLEAKEDWGDFVSETYLSHLFSPTYIVRTDIGLPHASKKNPNAFNLNFYSEKGESLQSFLSRNGHLTPKEANQIKLDLLLAVKELHDKGMVHQDIKPGNIILYKDPVYGYRAKLTDLGFCKKDQDIAQKALATVEFQSPEISCIRSNPQDTFFTYFNDALGKRSYGYQIWNIKRMVPQPEFAHPHRSNDMWALGITFFNIDFRHMPSYDKAADRQNIHSNALLNKLLESERAGRINIDDAITLHKINMSSSRRVKKIT